ncbi:UNVERIFIED_CONTAM: hypothetical protein GTU68_057175 [Idotea baltica]|nr:hypothetical protein [Idotea baltica]
MDALEQEAILLLADGTVYRGTSLGIIGTTTGEICFNTGMTGYQEIFTDPSYFGQILVSTNVHVGNYGIKKSDVESDRVQIAGFICRNYNVKYSRQMADETIQDYFVREQVVGICNVDTRSIVKHIRSKGAMNAIISSEILDVEELSKLELASKVTSSEPYELSTAGSRYRVAVYDFGVKKNILKCFTERSCHVKVFPADTDVEVLKAWNPDGYFLSNGPGDPGAMDYAVKATQAILNEDKPLFGICLGHQILARAVNISTYKMHHGHRGINHPVINLSTGKSEITSQNHGFGVSLEAIEKSNDVVVTHKNLNDQTIEGLSIKNKKAFSVQYHPEASPGPHDAQYLFDQFIGYMDMDMGDRNN